MRRTDREITDRAQLDAIVRSCQVCRLGLTLEGRPYVVPVSFGYDGHSLFIHTARKGAKLSAFGSNPIVCVEFEHNVRLVRSDRDPCAWTFHYESVIGYGRIGELTQVDRKIAGLQQIMHHYSGIEWSLPESTIARTRVWEISVETLTGKRSAEKPR